MAASQQPSADVVVRSLISLAVTLVVMGVLMFWPAGTLGWVRGWWFVAAFVVAILAGIVILWQVNPEIFAARAKVHSGTKGWDYAIFVIIVVAYMAVLPVAGLDDGRFHWLPMPDWVVIVGYVLFFASFGLMVWAQGVNRHFEPSVRIQQDRGQTVIDTGPYAIVRHPGYISGSAMAVGMALALGSLWALLPALVLIVTLVIRTGLEEETLVAELPGYAEYRARVRWRWVPGLW
jgi:protein-S-isoprenylcysteine O-methyltransferase Ste14